MRPKSKLEKWIERYIKAKNFGISEATKSRYYQFNTRILRISDHVAINSDGDIAIILDSHDEEHYLVHAVHSGEISVLTYEEIKKLIRSIALLPAIMHIANSKEEACINGVKPSIVEKQLTGKDTILGIPINRFTPGRLKTIKAIVKKQLKELKNN